MKPDKPYPDFPLFAHNNGCWAKKIRGRLHYFGVWSDPDGALAKYLGEKDDLHSGRTPRLDPQVLTIKDMCNAFRSHKEALKDAGELSPRSWVDNKEACDLLVAEFGKQRIVAHLRPDDFACLRTKLVRRWGRFAWGT